MRPLRIVLVLFLFLIPIKGINAQQQEYFPYKVKTLLTLNNKRYNSMYFSNGGKPIIIEFWASHCRPCIEQFNSIKSVYADWQQRYGVKLIAISMDRFSTRSRAKKLIKKHEWPFEFYFDTERTLSKRLKMTKFIPETVVYDGNFNVAGRIFGVDPNYGYRIKDGKKSEKISIKKTGKYAHLDMDLTEIENAIIRAIKVLE